jgi:hypothetical protein
VTWLREAISDENHLADMAYISIGAIAALLVGTVVYLCTMSTVSYVRCIQIDASSSHGILTAPCVFDPWPLASGIAAAIGAFGAPIGALAGYMAATRRQAKSTTTQTIQSVQTQESAPPAASAVAMVPTMSTFTPVVPSRRKPKKRRGKWPS